MNPIQFGSSPNLSHLSNKSATTTASTKEQPKTSFALGSSQQQDDGESNFEVFSMPSTADLNIPNLHGDTPSGSSSQSNSPTSMHVAKRARVINCGSDLIDEMRERYSCTKGADMFAPPSQYNNNQIPVQRVRPTPQLQPTYTSGPNKITLQTQVPSQFNFGGIKQEDNEMPRRFMGPSGQGSNVNLNNNSQANGAPFPRMPVYTGQVEGVGMNSGNSNMQPNANMTYRMPNTPNNNNVQQKTPGIYSKNNTSHYSQQSSVEASRIPCIPMYSTPQRNAPGVVNSFDGNMGYTTPDSRISNVNNSRLNSSRQPGTIGGPPMNMQNMMEPGSSRGQMQQQYHTPAHYSGLPQNVGNMGPGKMYPNMPDNMGHYDQSGYVQHRSQLNQSQYPTTSHRPVMGNYDNSNNVPDFRSQSPGFVPRIPPQTPPAGNHPGMNLPSSPSLNTYSGMPYHPSGRPTMSGQDAVHMNMSQSPQQQITIRPHLSSGPMSNPGVPGTGGVPGMSMFRRSSTGRLAPPPEELMQQIISDSSSAFRSHPLFPLLRDLIIADMNFNTDTFPYKLISHLPADFDKLLHNYISRNPPLQNLGPPNPSTEQVVMDALKYAHQSLIGKKITSLLPFGKSCLILFLVIVLFYIFDMFGK